jgi:Integrase zinc binding domain
MNNRLIVVGNDNLKRGVISLYHDFPTAGHPRGKKMLTNIICDYWWPTMRNDIKDFIKGCATCQATKLRTT